MTRISELTNMSAVNDDDLLVVVDVSDTSESPNGTTKNARADLFTNAYTLVEVNTNPFTVDNTHTSGSVFEQTTGEHTTVNVTTGDFAIGDILFFSAAVTGTTVDVGSGNAIYEDQTVVLGALQSIGIVKYSATIWLPITRGVYSMFRFIEVTTATKTFFLSDMNPGSLLTYYNTYNAGVAAWTLPTKNIMDNYLTAANTQQITIKNISGSNNMTVAAGTSTTIEGGTKTLADGASITLAYIPGSTATWFVLNTYGTVT